MPEAPFYGEINQGNAAPPKGPTTIYDLMRAGEDRLRKMMGPHAYESVGRLADIAGFVGPQADVVDYNQQAQSALQNIAQGNYGQGAIDAGYAGLSGMGLSELSKAGAALGVALRPAEQQGIRAYHGSPHDFDRFQMDKIGTGEGAQAYGHGLYFAENEGTARAYRDDLTSMRVDRAQREIDRVGGDVNAALDAQKQEIERLMSLPNAGNDDARRDRFVALAEETIAELNALKRNGKLGAGRMYEVNINANPDDFLDWDAPVPVETPDAVARVVDEMELVADNDYQLYQQRDRVQSAIDAYRENPTDKTARRRIDNFLRAARPDYRLKDIEESLGDTRGDLYRRRERQIGQIEARRELLEQNPEVPGIKYLDQGSRDSGEGTRNYVVFDDSLIEIVRKYGIAALVGGGVISATVADQLREQGYTDEPGA